jgi:hypothetical protein
MFYKKERSNATCLKLLGSFELNYVETYSGSADAIFYFNLLLIAFNLFFSEAFISNCCDQF